ncbi:MAG: carboxypeptidase-like regulatory domain-containing protein, partial [Bacteroidota bacterium]|nr:carboxypeptidase-like regulatory domain-containing protein [Bacteroidota bacterium]
MSLQASAFGSTFRNNENGPVAKAPDGVQQKQRKITGTVIDASTGESLVGVTVMIVGTKQGVVTDAKGTFSLTLPNPNAEIRVTYVGYVQQQIPVNGQIKIDVKLAPDVKNLGEVVVVGYGTQKKESVVGAITMVNNAALLKAGTQNVTNAITGKLSGVLTIQDTGEPGADNTEVLIRGVSSWN